MIGTESLSHPFRRTYNLLSSPQNNSFVTMSSVLLYIVPTYKVTNQFIKQAAELFSSSYAYVTHVQNLALTS
jgi:hypothetical protein